MDLPLEIEVSIHFIFTFTTLQTTNESIKYNKVLKLSIRKQSNYPLEEAKEREGGWEGEAVHLTVFITHFATSLT